MPCSATATSCTAPGGGGGARGALFSRLARRGGGGMPEEAERCQRRWALDQRTAEQVATHTVDTGEREAPDIANAILGALGELG